MAASPGVITFGTTFETWGTTAVKKAKNPVTMWTFLYADLCATASYILHRICLFFMPLKMLFLLKNPLCQPFFALFFFEMRLAFFKKLKTNYQ
jgi:hypothetical protein